MSAATLRSRRPRSAGSIFAHAGSRNAFSAAATAWRASSSVAAGTFATTDWSKGFTSGRVAPSLAATHCPAMNIFSSLVIVSPIARSLLEGAPSIIQPRAPSPSPALAWPMTRLFVGTSGYVYPHWKGRFYPEDVPQKRWFSYYAERFDAVEINNTFYRMPSEKVVASWKEQAPDGFVYAF